MAYSDKSLSDLATLKLQISELFKKTKKKLHTRAQIWFIFSYLWCWTVLHLQNQNR